MVSIELIFAALAGLALFIYSVKSLTKEIEIFVKDEIKDRFLKIRNPYVNVIIGFILTTLLQSSSAFSVLTISLVTASAISLRQAFALLIGANIGSTTTAQLVSFNIFFLGPALIAIGFFTSFLRRFAVFGRAIFLLGLVLFSLNYIKTVLNENTELINILKERTGIELFLLSALLTVILQSSGIISSFAVILASNNQISTYQSIFIILGGNIGTVSTALIASSIADRFGKAVSQFHLMFNSVVVIIGLIFINHIYYFMSSLSQDPARFVANTHTLLNVVAGILTFISLPYIERALRAYNNLPQQILIEARYLDNKEKNVAKRIKNIRNQLDEYLNTIEIMASEIKRAVEKEENIQIIIDKYYAYTDFMYNEITNYIAKTQIKETDVKNAEKLSNLSKFCVLLKDLSKRLRNIYDSINIFRLDTKERYYIVETADTLIEALRALRKNPNKEISKSYRDKMFKIADDYYGHVILRFEESYKGSLGKVFVLIAQIEKLGSEIPQLGYVMKKLNWARTA
jgi:phosphate:Na+ symporter